MTNKLALPILLLLASHAKAQPAPAWCKNVEHESRSTYLDILRDPDENPDRIVHFLVYAICDPRDDESAARGELEALRQQMMKRMAITEADWVGDVMAWWQLPFPGNPTLMLPDKQPWSKLGPLDQYALFVQTGGDSAAFALQSGAKHYMADAFALTETGRFAYILQCIHPDTAGPVEWAVCQPDIDALDRAKLGQELRADTAHKVIDRMRVRFALGKLERKLQKHAAKVKKLVAGDKVYGQAFEIARKARADWDARAGERAGALALVLAMDDARATRSRSALAGCSEKAWPAFAAAVAKLPAKRFENLRGPGVIGAMLHHPDVYLAANALVACEGPRDYLLKQIETGLGTGYRGPRTAAFNAINDANLVPDERGSEQLRGGGRVALAIGTDKSPYVDSAKGVIAAVKERGDAVEIAFAKTSEIQDHCQGYRATKRIQRITDSGDVIYEQVCTGWVTARTDTTPSPVLVPKRYGAGLQKGRYVIVVGGTVEGVWAKPNGATPIAAFGVALRD